MDGLTFRVRHAGRCAQVWIDDLCDRLPPGVCLAHGIIAILGVAGRRCHLIHAVPHLCLSDVAMCIVCIGRFHAQRRGDLLQQTLLPLLVCTSVIQSGRYIGRPSCLTVIDQIIVCIIDSIIL